MRDFSAAAVAEVFVSDTSMSRAVSEAVARGRLRKLGSRLYARNLTDEPEPLVRRNWYRLTPAYFPDAVICDRTALEACPAGDGSVCLISAGKREVVLPGLIMRPREGPGALDSDRVLVGGARLSSIARAYLENMRPSRARGDRLPRSLSRADIESRLHMLIRRHGNRAAQCLRNEARAIAEQLGLEREFGALDELVSMLLPRKRPAADPPSGPPRGGREYDTRRTELFDSLVAALRGSAPAGQRSPPRSVRSQAELCFHEAYFSNFIAGNRFDVDTARQIVFAGQIPRERHDDAAALLGVHRIVSNPADMQLAPVAFEGFLAGLRRRHATVAAVRRDRKPGQFKNEVNHGDDTMFVLPDLVSGTLEKGFERLHSLSEPFSRAVFMLILVGEVHPFPDSNGLLARMAMNTELVAAGEERIIAVPALQGDFRRAYRALTRDGRMEPLITMLQRCQHLARGLDWSDPAGARAMLCRQPG